jgi:hypothetical protein
MKQKTAVEWLVKELNQKIDFIPLGKWDMIRDIIQQAKEMEKAQIENAWGNERQVVFMDSFEDTLTEDTVKELAEHYYNETYGGNK